jgi:hypothetical protein
MAKRITKAESAVIGALLIIGMPVFLISKFVESVGGVAATIAVLSVIAAIVWVKDSQKKKRLAHLRAKYSNELVVQSILNGDVWQGQTAEQLLDSLGPPSDIDCKLLKTKSKDTWKYYHRGGNRYALRITVENGVVVGWDKKT